MERNARGSAIPPEKETVSVLEFMIALLFYLNPTNRPNGLWRPFDVERNNKSTRYVQISIKTIINQERILIGGSQKKKKLILPLDFRVNLLIQSMSYPGGIRGLLSPTPKCL